MGTALFFGPFHTGLQKCFQVFEARGVEVFWEKQEQRFLELLKHRQPSVVIAESRAHGNSCRTLTDTVISHSPHTTVIILTEGGVCPDAFLLGPRLESVCQARHTVPEDLLLTAEKLLFSEAFSPSDLPLGLFGRTSSLSMKHVAATIKQIVDTDALVLLRGESGVGKGVIASYIHTHSLRSAKPFIKINCAALPSELLESELFGFERGAFTGAMQAKPGRFESADGGTLLLDEVGELPLSMQAKLLHVLESNQFSRLGASKDIQVDVRVLASTNRDLELAVNAGNFRKDLYYRLKVVTLTIPPVRERIEEIPLLVEYFNKKFAKRYERPTVLFSPNVWSLFQSYSWPGNVRELENLVKRAVILQDASFLEKELKMEKAASAVNGLPLSSGGLKGVSRRASRLAEREAILKTLQHTNWNRTLTAQILQVSYKTLLYKMQEAGLRGSAQQRLNFEEDNCMKER
jgi:DNA-binding NtrC family response regulator